MKVNKEDIKGNLDIDEMAKIYAIAREEEDKRTFTNKYGNKIIDMGDRFIFIEKTKSTTQQSLDKGDTDE